MSSTEAVNRVCLVCDSELEPGGERIVQVNNLNYHRDCLGYIPKPHKWDRIDQDTGHAIWRRHGHDVDLSVLLGVKPDRYYRPEEIDDVQ